MTREEARMELIRTKRVIFMYDLPSEAFEAIDMAIEALSNYTTKKPNDEVEQKNDVVAEPTDLISRVDAIEAIESRQTEQWIDADVDYNNGLESAVSEIKALPSAELTLQTPQTYGKSINPSNAEVVADLISRAELLDRIKAINSIPWGDDHGNAVKLVWSTEEVKRLIEKAPSADRPIGEWKPVSEGLPQSVGSYLVTCKGEYGFIYVDYDFWTVADKFKYNRSKVTAWIPFPKPYCVEEMKGEKQMSVSKWAYTEECNGKFCCGECDLCHDRPEEKEEDDD